MPTLNPVYNKYFRSISGQNLIVSVPGCEDCGKDLTGKNIIDTGLVWCCEDCAKNKSNWAELGKEINP